MRIFTSIFFVAFLFGTTNAQININTKNLKKIKKVVDAVSEDDNAKPTQKPTENVVEKNTTNNTNTSNTSSSTEESPKELYGWTKDEMSDIGFTNAYFLGGGWIVDDIEARSQYNDELKVPVVEVNYYSSCYKQPFKLHVFKMADKGSVGNYDFEGNASKTHPEGRYKSEMVIVDHDKYIMVFSYFSKLEPELDRYMDEKYPELQRRLPNEW